MSIASNTRLKLLHDAIVSVSLDTLSRSCSLLGISRA
jgi:hypothetical protein